MAKLVECIPNFSVSKEKDEPVFQGLVDTANSVPGCTVMDVQSDGTHNRCVFTLVGSPEGIEEVAFQLCKKAAETIDMTKHEGAHPRMAKTQFSFSDDPSKLGAPRGFKITVRELKVNAGAGFLVAKTGDIMTMEKRDAGGGGGDCKTESVNPACYPAHDCKGVSCVLR